MRNEGPDASRGVPSLIPHSSFRIPAIIPPDYLDMTAASLPTTNLASLLYGDLEHELAQTRRLLERYPEGKGDWQPHAKSMVLSRLAVHVAELPGLGPIVIETDELDFATSGYKPTPFSSAADLVAIFDRKVADLRRAIARIDLELLERPWTLRNGSHVILTQPKGALLRGLVINHIVHHRAQLGVYYRLLGVPVPGMYGPSADEM